MIAVIGFSFIVWLWLIKLENLALALFTALVEIVAIYVAREDWLQRSRTNSEKVSKKLARAVANRWESETTTQGVNNPFPLSVKFEVTDSVKQLIPRWSDIVRMATYTSHLSVPSSHWATGYKDLTGKLEDIAKIYRSVPTGRLLILGECGAGKSISAIHLTLGLLKNPQARDPVPVPLRPALWNPAEQSFRNWLIACLESEYPFLAAGTMPGSHKQSQAEKLVIQGRILPILDGLDEMPERLRIKAIEALNNISSQHRLVVTCRTGKYAETIAPEDGGGEGQLVGAAAIELQALNQHDIIGYFSALQSEDARARWAPIIKTIAVSPWAPLAQALSTPLMASLAYAIYNPPSGTLKETKMNPSELLDKKAFPDRESIEAHILENFVPASYRPRLTNAGIEEQWPPRKAQYWLGFLADHVERYQAGTFSWWKLSTRLPSWFDRLFLFGVTASAVYLISIFAKSKHDGGFISLDISIWISALVLCAIVIAAREASSSAFQLVCMTRLQIKRFLYGMIVGLAIGLGIILLSFVPSVAANKPIVFEEILPFFLISGLLIIGFGVLCGLTVKVDVAQTVGPKKLLARSRLASLVIIGMCGAGGCLGAFALMWPWEAGPDEALTIFGAFFALGGMVGMVLVSNIGWMQFVVVRSLLALRGQLPWRLMKFLHDASKRQILRQIGAGYQFRHESLQNQLAASYRNKLTSKHTKSKKWTTWRPKTDPIFLQLVDRIIWVLIGGSVGALLSTM